MMDKEMVHILGRTEQDHMKFYDTQNGVQFKTDEVFISENVH